MSDVRILFGRLFNALEGAGLVTVSSQNSLYDLANLWSGHVSDPFVFALVTDQMITADLDRLGATGGMEVWDGGSMGVPNGWTKDLSGSGVVQQETVIKHSGSLAAKLSCTGADLAQIRKDFEAKVGSEQNVEVYLRGDGTIPIRLRIQDLASGLYLADGNPPTWVPAVTDLFAVSSAAGGETEGYTKKVLTFTLPDYLSLYLDVTTVRVSALVNQDGAGYIDGVTIFPTIDHVSLHGLPNLDASIAIEIRSDGAGFAGAGTLETTLAVRRPSVYAVLSPPVKKRWLRVVLKGTNLGIGAPWPEPAIGKLVVGKALVLEAHPEYPIRIRHVSRQLRNETAEGDVFRYARSIATPRVATLPITFLDLEEFQEARDMLERTVYGVYPMVLIPDDTDPEVCIYGNLMEPSWDEERRFVDVRAGELVVVEEPFPRLLP